MKGDGGALAYETKVVYPGLGNSFSVSASTL